MTKNLLEIDDAWRLIFESVDTNSTETVNLNEAVGRTLANAVSSDLDSPPFDKSLVDGVALANWVNSGQEFEVVETVTAGHVPKQSLGGNQATRIMTGCPLPRGTLGVVMIEETEEVNQDRIRVHSAQFRPGQNILRQGTVIARGQSLLTAGQTIRPTDLGALAEFGLTELSVFRASRLSVLTTGDELVQPDQEPGPGQIRNSNASLLMSLAKSAGASVIDLGIGRDSLEALQPKIAKGLEGDVLVIAGGVSAGKLDLIPQCLDLNGVQKIFHKINLKPGKPLWFGKAPTGCLVFGLPGNPVSSLVCFKLFAEPAILKQSRPQLNALVMESGVLAKPFVAKSGRRTFWPIRYCSKGGENVTGGTEDRSKKGGEGYFEITPLPWKGSADQVTFLGANGLMDLGQLSGELQPGTPVQFLPF